MLSRNIVVRFIFFFQGNAINENVYLGMSIEQVLELELLNLFNLVSG